MEKERMSSMNEHCVYCFPPFPHFGFSPNSFPVTAAQMRASPSFFLSHRVRAAAVWGNISPPWEFRVANGESRRETPVGRPFFFSSLSFYRRAKRRKERLSLLFQMVRWTPIGPRTTMIINTSVSPSGPELNSSRPPLSNNWCFTQSRF